MHEEDTPAQVIRRQLSCVGSEMLNSTFQSRREFPLDRSLSSSASDSSTERSFYERRFIRDESFNYYNYSSITGNKRTSNRIFEYSRVTLISSGDRNDRSCRYRINFGRPHGFRVCRIYRIIKLVSVYFYLFRKQSCGLLQLSYMILSL